MAQGVIHMGKQRQKRIKGTGRGHKQVARQCVSLTEPFTSSLLCASSSH